jgi:hypothetical protein
VSIPALIRLELLVARKLNPDGGWRDLSALCSSVQASIGREPARATALSALSREVSAGRVERDIGRGAGRPVRWRWKEPA